MTMTPIAVIIGSVVAVAVTVLVIIFVLVPLFRGIGWMIGGFFRGLGWAIAHLFGWLFGTLGDLVRFVGSIPVFLIFSLLALGNVVIGRWSAAGHFADSAQRECGIGAACLYRALIRRPLRLVMLHGLLEGLEERVPQAMEDAPGRDRPTSHTGQFEGYTIIGSLRAGGSGGKLYVAEPTPEKRRQIRDIPERVVIKSFALTDGSSLPQIVRESRALECAKAMGHVIEHGMTPTRFHYVMPYIPGEHLGAVMRELHARSGARDGLEAAGLRDAARYISDLLATLSAYHRGGFWHKDVKPENVIIHDGRAHLVDLGLVTPLHSAMTLTTHGTEYFRDPELVRQALRGVKVHQVDGAKFDVYAVGAVLYFVLENTFPAHGALSAFTKNSPEALKWIVRRAMAEYQQRYQSADLMLADLHVVMTARDPFTVRPIDLPSMRGETPADQPAIDPPTPADVRWANTPRPQPPQPAITGFGAAAGIGAAGGFTQVGRINIDAAKPRRPKLKVTNWWTGAYVVEDAGVDAPAHEYRFDNVAHADASRLGEARRKAQEQVAGARARAEALRERVRTSRAKHLRHPAERQPGAMLWVLSALFLGGILTTSFFVFTPKSVQVRATVNGQPLSATDSAPLVYALLDSIRPDDPRVLAAAQRLMTAQHDRGQDVRLADDDLLNALLPATKDMSQGRTRARREAFEAALETANAYGVLYLRDHGDRGGRPSLRGDLYVSERAGARGRVAIDPSSNLIAHLEPAGTLLIINEHPLTDEATRRRLDELFAEYEARGGTLRRGDVELESSFRVALALMARESEAGRDRFHALLNEHDLDGVLIVEAVRDDEGKPTDRLHARVLTGE